MRAIDVSNVKSVKEMKDILFKKLQEEETNFRKNELFFTPTEFGYYLGVKGYENLHTCMKWDYDDIFGYEVWVYEDGEIIDMVTSKTVLDVYTALIHLGYHIATTY